METPKLSWYLVNQDTYSNIEQECYAGNFSFGSSTVEIKLELWNNRWGDTDVEDISETSNLVLGFSTFEDSKLLELCKVKIDGFGYLSPNLLMNKGYIPLGKVLSGKSNDGGDDATQNFIQISILFDITDVTLKDGLKSLYLDLEYIK